MGSKLDLGLTEQKLGTEPWQFYLVGWGSIYNWEIQLRISSILTILHQMYLHVIKNINSDSMVLSDSALSARALPKHKWTLFIYSRNLHNLSQAFQWWDKTWPLRFHNSRVAWTRISWNYSNNLTGSQAVQTIQPQVPAMNILSLSIEFNWAKHKKIWLDDYILSLKCGYY